MTSEQLQPFLNWARKRYSAFVRFRIFLINYLLRKRLKVKGASLGEILLIKGSPINIEWEASGCHKIAIEKLGVFPGNLKGITYDCVALPQEIVITFYGFNGRTKVIIDVPQAHSVKLKNRFNTGLQLSPIKWTAFGQTFPASGVDKDLSRINRFKIEVPNANLLIGNTPLICTLPEARIELPKFKQQNFSKN